MCAIALRHDAEADKLHIQLERIRWLNFPSLAWAVLIAGSRAYFGPQPDLREVSGVVADMRRAFGDGVPGLETEALIRLALGDEDVDTTGISEETMVRAATITITSIADFWGQDESKMFAIFERAEATVRERGIALTRAP
jgi:hypothetical protein